MRIVVYASCASVFDGAACEQRTFPSCREEWAQVARDFPGHEFVLVTQRPGTFLLDMEGDAVGEGADGVRYVVLGADADAARMAQEILSLSPALAIAASFWLAPYDWFSVEDALVAESLRRAGIRTVCHPVQASLCCMDKWRTQQFLERHGFRVPRAVYVHHDLFWCERRSRDVARNVYKEQVLSQIERLQYPVLIKDTTGLSSYRLERAASFREARAYLLSGRNSADKLVQEYVEGRQFGAELFATDSACTVFPPFLFSVNKYGVTSPKQSVKVGPVLQPECTALAAELRRFSALLHLDGPAQVDVVHSGGTWYFIEVNPRLSGMSQTVAASMGMSLPALLVSAALGLLPARIPPERLRCTCNLKLPVLGKDQLARLAKAEGVLQVKQVHNKAAKQERERGYAELILGGAPDWAELGETLARVADAFPECMEGAFVEKARALIAGLEPDGAASAYGGMPETVAGDSVCAGEATAPEASPLQSAHDCLRHAAALGFEWPDVQDAAAKVREELQEVLDARAEHDARHVEEEVGDLFLSAVNLARLCGVEPGRALSRATRKFQARFAFVEAALKASPPSPGTDALPQMELLWQAAKSQGL